MCAMLNRTQSQSGASTMQQTIGMLVSFAQRHVQNQAVIRPGNITTDWANGVVFAAVVNTFVGDDVYPISHLDHESRDGKIHALDSAFVVSTLKLFDFQSFSTLNPTVSHLRFRFPTFFFNYAVRLQPAFESETSHRD